MKRRTLALLIVLLVVLVVVLSLVLYNEWPFLTGKKIVLATRPVDPFDPFLGQYMNIAYEISRVTSGDFNQGDDIYVSLKEDEQGIWRSAGVRSSRPSSGDFIRGRVEWVRGEDIGIIYGIEQFYFERGAQMPTWNITVEVYVSNSGRAKLSQLLHEGKPIEITYKNFSIRD